MSRTIGLIAGVGRLPDILAAKAKERGERLVAVRGVTDGTPSALPQLADACYDIFFGHWNSIVDTLKSEGVQKVYLAGKMSRELLFSENDFDPRFERIIFSLTERNDDAVVTGFIHDLEGEGISVGEQVEYLEDLSFGAGVLTGETLSPGEWYDVARGFRVAKAVAGLDVGQTVVVKAGAVLAVEGVEGTDECIRRGSALGRGASIVVKVAKPEQDLRFDVPTIGLDTLHVMREAGARVLAFEAGRTFLVEGAELIAFARAHGLVLVSYTPGMETKG